MGILKYLQTAGFAFAKILSILSSNYFILQVTYFFESCQKVLEPSNHDIQKVLFSTFCD